MYASKAVLCSFSPTPEGMDSVLSMHSGVSENEHSKDLEAHIHDIELAYVVVGLLQQRLDVLLRKEAVRSPTRLLGDQFLFFFYNKRRTDRSTESR